MLFGVLIGSVGMFSSCKDYDDDIDAVNNRVDGLETALNDLKALVQSQTYVKSVSYDAATGELSVDGTKYKIAPNLPNYTISVDKDGKVSLLKDGTEVSSGNITFPDAPVVPEAFDPSKLSIDASGKVLYDGKETKVTIPTGFDASKLSYDPATGKLKYNGVDTDAEIQLPDNFNPGDLTLDGNKVQYNGVDTGVTLPAEFAKDGLTYDPTTGKLLYNGEPTGATLPAIFDASDLVLDEDTREIMFGGQSTGIIIPSAFDPTKLKVLEDGTVVYGDDNVPTNVTVPLNAVTFVERNGVAQSWIVQCGDEQVTLYSPQSAAFMKGKEALKGLVFKPALVVGGNPAIEYPYVQYQAWVNGARVVTTYTDETATQCNVEQNQNDWNYAQAGPNGYYGMTATAQYNLNPSGANVVKNDLSFVADDIETRSSAVSVALVDLNSTQDIELQGGVLSVGLQVSRPDEFANLQANSQAPWVALQAQVMDDDGGGNAITVTSDRAMLYPSQIIPQAIAFGVDGSGRSKGTTTMACQQIRNGNELYTTVPQAIQNAPSVRVAYNSQLDLKQYLVIHYNQAGQPTALGSDGNHKVIANGREGDYGLTYDYKYIDYTAGTTTTHQSNYADPDVISSGIVKPCAVASDGNPNPNVQDNTSIGRKPLVRVLVKQGNNIVLVGFVKIEITAVTPTPSELDAFNFGDFNFLTDNYDVANCGGAGHDLELTWSQFSAEVLSAIGSAGMSKNDFDAIYSLDMNAGEARQFSRADVAAELIGPDKIGQITEAINIGGTTTSVLQWNLDDVSQNYVYEQTGHKAKVYVRYVKANPAEAPIWIPLEVTVNKVPGRRSGETAVDWTGNAVELNVNAPADNGNTNVYAKDLDEVWRGGRPDFGQTGNLNFANYKYFFTAENNRNVNSTVTVDGITYELTVASHTGECIDGNTYNVYANNLSSMMDSHTLRDDRGIFNNNTLSCRGEVIATLNQTTGEITYNPASNIAKILLNSDKAARGTAQYFAKVGICVSNGCNQVMPLDRPTFDAKFIRPINAINNPGTLAFTNGEDNGSVLPLANLIKFTDWRNMSFGKDNVDNSWYYAFYGFSKVEVKINDVQVDERNDGKWTPLNTTLTDVALSHVRDDGTTLIADAATPGSQNLNFVSYNTQAQGTQVTYDAVKAAMGKLKYVNNNAITHNTFKLRIPVEFTYTWGVLKTNVEVTVNPTLGR